ncbi:hypothetical protein AGMMS50212_02980 [Spirochaetia bacterium]|nr:hypothetical protein AGMMS50212_02980 [Spirochaetia bacterium]
MKIACVGYRDWTLKIYNEIIRCCPEHEYLRFNDVKEYDAKRIFEFNPDFILYYGWSEKVGEEIFSKYKSVVLHISPLPKYRGGSPIQNQIIRCETKSAVTLFFIDGGIDTGDIIAQGEISLAGHLFEIFDRIIDVGICLTLKMLSGDYKPRKQNNAEATSFKRRTPEESEITLDELQNKEGLYLYNKIRMLEDPYPNAFIKTKDGKKLYIKLAELDE